MISHQSPVTPPRPPTSRWSALMIAGVYFIVAGIWIAASDEAIEWLGPRLGVAPEVLQTFKGMLFVLITAVMLYLLIVRSMRRQEAFGLELAAAQERSELAFQASAEGVWDWIIPEGKLFWSPRLEQMLGFDAGELEANAMGWSRRLHPDDREGILAKLRGHLERGEPYEVIYRLRLKDQSYHWFEARGVAVRDARNRPVRMIGSLKDVHERVEAQRLQREADEVYRQMFHSNQAIKIVADPTTGAIVDANQAAIDFYAYEPQRLFTKTISDLNAKTQAEAMEILLKIVSGEQRRFECQHRTAHGQIRAVEVHAGPVTVKNQQLIFSIIHDITERKRTEEALLKSEATNWALLSAIPDAMFVYHRRRGTIESFVGDRSPAHVREQTRAASWIVGEDEKIVGVLRKHLNKLFATDESQTFEYEQLRASPSAGNHAAKETWEVRMARSGPEEALLLVRNITARVEAERRMAESDRRLALLVENTPLGVIFWDRDFRIVKWNPAAQRLFGYSADEALGRSFDFLVAPEDQKYVQTIVADLFKKTGKGLRGTNRNIHKSGKMLYCEWYNTPLIAPDGLVMGVASVVEDVSERRELQLRQQRMMAELDHRVKNNLAAIVSIAQQTGRSARDYREFVESFAGRLEAMSRMHSIMAGSSTQEAELGGLVRETLAAFGSTTAARIRIDGPPVMLEGRAAQALAMALNELGTNAIKYGSLSTTEGGVEVSWSMVYGETGGTDNAQGHHAGQLHLVWCERGGPEVKPPTRRGFGSELIEGTIAYELGGQVRMQFDPVGVVCTIFTPVAREENMADGLKVETRA